MLKKRGFTLFELIFVAGLIALFASIVLASLANARVNSRNTTKVNSIREYRNAIALFFSEHGSYPDPGDLGTHCLGELPDGTCNGSSPVHPVLKHQVQEFFSSYPGDLYAVGPGLRGFFYTCTERADFACKSFKLVWHVEGDNSACNGETVTGTGSGFTSCEINFTQ